MEVELPFAAVNELEERWRPLSDAERETAHALLLDASQLIVDEDPAAASANEATLRRVVCAMVRRAMMAPGGIGVETMQQGAGPFQQSVKYANPAGDLYLTRQERRALGMLRQRAFEVDLLGGEDPWTLPLP